MRRAVAVVIGVGVLAAAIAVGAWLLRSGEAGPTRAAEPDPASSAPTPEPGPVPRQATCGDAHAEPFEPDRISIEGIVDDAEVVGTPRDSRGVPGVLSLGATEQFAYDVDGIRPGEPRGNVLINTHTWPDGDGAGYPALGNALLDRLDLGDRIVLSGDGWKLCYEVTRIVKVLASEGYPPYYATEGPPRVAIIVCSGKRTGPGEWTHRTMWFARATAVDR